MRIGGESPWAILCISIIFAAGYRLAGAKALASLSTQRRYTHLGHLSSITQFICLMRRGNIGHRVLAEKMQAGYVERQVTFTLADSDDITLS